MFARLRPGLPAFGNAGASVYDIAGSAAAKGILTCDGGRTSHAAVVVRQLDKVCLVGCEALSIEPAARRCLLGKRQFREGEVITLDGRSGNVFAGSVVAAARVLTEYLEEVASWRAKAGQGATKRSSGVDRAAV